MTDLKLDTYRPDPMDREITDEMMHLLETRARYSRRPKAKAGQRERWSYLGRYGKAWVWVLHELSPMTQDATVVLFSSSTPGSCWNRAEHGGKHA